MSTSEHTPWREEIAAYLLGALNPEETAAVESHLESCERCGEELIWLQPAVDLLPESVEQLDPPPELRERLLVEIGAAHAPPAAEDGERRRRSDRRRGGGRVSSFFLRPAVALGAVALIAAAIGGYSLAGGGDDRPTITTPPAQGLGDLSATLERSGDQGTLKMTGLRQAPSSHVYQAWVQSGEKIQSSALFDAGRDRRAAVAIPQSLKGVDAVMVTIEPRGGSRQPSETPVIEVPLGN